MFVLRYGLLGGVLGLLLLVVLMHAFGTSGVTPAGLAWLFFFAMGFGFVGVVVAIVGLFSRWQAER